jgi:phosphoglycerate kinase
MLRPLKSFDIKGQTILLRLDLNVPIINGIIQDDFRIKACLPTIKHCLKEGAAVVIMSHLGRPEGTYSDDLSLIPIGEHLASLLELPIKFSKDCISQDALDTSLSLKSGEVHLLENLRFHKEETQNDSVFSNKLSKHGRLYINDAFGSAHRAHSSNHAVIDNFKNFGIGYLFEKEMKYLKDVINKPKKPLVLILGGAKISTKLGLIDRYVHQADSIIVGGGMAFTFLKAMGYSVGNSLVESKMITKAKNILDIARNSGKKIILPTDVVCSNNISVSEPGSAVSVRDIPDDMMGLDIGPKTIEKYLEALSSAKTILWNGPMGVFENKFFENGTRSIAEKLVEIALYDSTVIAGGGDTASALRHFKLAEKITHVSTGGGASLALMSGNQLKAINKLEI